LSSYFTIKSIDNLKEGTMQTTLTAAEKLLSILPLLTRVIAVKLREDIDEEITLAQFRILTQLQEQPCTLSELAEQRHITRQAASLQVQGLADRGWIRRVPDLADRRQSLLEVTDKGLAQWRESQQSLAEYLAGFLDAFSTEESAALEILIPAFQRIIDQARVEKSDKRMPLEE
jgi:DNA-binding MarR family transcriptional regulator